MASKSKRLIASAIIIIIACSALLIGCQYLTNSGITPDRDTIFQLAAFNTFSTGKYAGFMPYSELERHGDFGIGTFDGLDGEMLALDGVFYQIPSSGTPKIAEPTQTSPHATVTFFDTDQTFTVTNRNYTELRSYLDSQLSSDKDVIYAIKVHGNFSYLQARSPAKQAEPYPGLTDALKTQSVWTFNNVQATAVGYLFPNSMTGVDPAGYHLHIITDDKTAGGHMLECIINNATIEVDVIKNYNLILP